jgi:hypothetical protein
VPLHVLHEQRQEKEASKKYMALKHEIWEGVSSQSFISTWRLRRTYHVPGTIRYDTMAENEKMRLEVRYHNLGHQVVSASGTMERPSRWGLRTSSVMGGVWKGPREEDCEPDVRMSAIPACRLDSGAAWMG